MLAPILKLYEINCVVLESQAASNSNASGHSAPVVGLWVCKLSKDIIYIL